jgi:hypothetical protein
LPKMLLFAHKYLTRYTRHFLRIHEFWRSLLKPLLSYTSSKFRKSYTPPATWIRVNPQLS